MKDFILDFLFSKRFNLFDIVFIFFIIGFLFPTIGWWIIPIIMIVGIISFIGENSLWK